MEAGREEGRKQGREEARKEGTKKERKGSEEARKMSHLCVVTQQHCQQHFPAILDPHPSPPNLSKFAFL